MIDDTFGTVADRSTAVLRIAHRTNISIANKYFYQLWLFVYVS